MKFEKRPWRVSVRQLRQNFETLLAEVERGRTLLIGDRARLCPIGIKERVGWRRGVKAHRRWRPRSLDVRRGVSIHSSEQSRP
jgi:antitoxin (DNA-binding transcriptional repressor) of toxin-antitoxin stability system